MDLKQIIAILKKFDPNFNPTAINTISKIQSDDKAWEITKIILSIYPDSIAIITTLAFYSTKQFNTIKNDYALHQEIRGTLNVLIELFTSDGIYLNTTLDECAQLLSSLNSNIKIRVLLIRFAYLLYIITSNSDLSDIEYHLIGKEICKIYIPVFKEIKGEQIRIKLQDSCFKILNPTFYKHIISFLEKQYPHYEQSIIQIIDTLHELLSQTNIEYTISHRIKSPYSIASKTICKINTMHELYDIFGIRIIVQQIKECYYIINIIHKHCRHIQKRYKNFIKSSKNNGYQSLHTVIINKGLYKTEIQVRTRLMHNIAEYGTAAHLQYKSQIRSIELPSIQAAYERLNLLILNILGQCTRSILDNSSTIRTQFKSHIFVSDRVAISDITTKHDIFVNNSTRAMMEDILGNFDEWLTNEVETSSAPAHSNKNKNFSAQKSNQYSKEAHTNTDPGLEIDKAIKMMEDILGNFDEWLTNEVETSSAPAHSNKNKNFSAQKSNQYSKEAHTNTDEIESKISEIIHNINHIITECKVEELKKLIETDDNAIITINQKIKQYLEQHNPQLLQAVQNEEVNQVKELLQNDNEHNDITAHITFMFAVHNGHISIAQELVKLQDKDNKPIIAVSKAMYEENAQDLDEGVEVGMREGGVQLYLLVEYLQAKIMGKDEKVKQLLSITDALDHTPAVDEVAGDLIITLLRKERESDTSSDTENSFLDISGETLVDLDYSTL